MGRIPQFSIVQFMGHISQISHVQSAFFRIMFYGCVEPSWMVPFPSLLVCHHSIYFCAIIILIIFCRFEWILWFCLSFWPFIHYRCMWLWAVLLLVLKFFSLYLKIFSTVCLFPSLQAYKKICKWFWYCCFEEISWWHCLLYDKWNCHDGSTAMGACWQEHWDYVWKLLLDERDFGMFLIIFMI